MLCVDRTASEGTERCCSAGCGALRGCANLRQISCHRHQAGVLKGTEPQLRAVTQGSGSDGDFTGAAAAAGACPPQSEARVADQGSPGEEQAEDLESITSVEEGAPPVDSERGACTLCTSACCVGHVLGFMRLIGLLLNFEREDGMLLVDLLKTAGTALRAMCVALHTVRLCSFSKDKQVRRGREGRVAVYPRRLAGHQRPCLVLGVHRARGQGTL